MTPVEPASRGQRPLHVLTITPFYPREGNESGGCFVAEPLGELKKLGLQTTVFAVEPLYRPKPRTSSLAPAAAWFRYPALPGNRGLASAGLGLFLRLRRAVRALHARCPVDLIHAHGALPCGHAALWLSRDLKIPYVVTVHGLDAFSTVQVQGRAGARCAQVSRRVYAGACQVIGVSRRVGDELRKGLDDSRMVSVVYNGADPVLFHPGNDSAHPVILTVGNLIPSKGHSLVVNALADLRRQFPDLVWEVIGNGPELDRIRQLAEKVNVLQAIRFSGRLDRAALAEAYRRCTVFVLPSRYEGLGCVYLEAMASGKVAIGVEGQGIEEVIRHGENGWLIPPRGQAELIQGLHFLLQNGSRRTQIGTAARNTILESFTLQHQARRLAEVYEENLR